MRSPDTITVLADLGSAIFEQGRPEEALELLEEALQLSIEVRGEHHVSTATLRATMGSCLFAAGLVDEAYAAWDQALADSPEGHPQRAQLEAFLATLDRTR